MQKSIVDQSKTMYIGTYMIIILIQFLFIVKVSYIALT